MNKIYNFSAGPATLPTAVLEQAKEELMDWQGSGLSVMEVSHRSPAFMAMAAETEADFRELLAIPDNYKVLFMQGGATAQFAMVPLNLLGDKDKADYVVTGTWSQKAVKQAGAYCTAHVAASAEENEFTAIPEFDSWQLNADAAYVHYTPNETIHGMEFHWTPETGDVPLVADMSSTILSRPTDISKFGLIYAGAQKNFGPSGITVVIIREDLLGKAHPKTPGVFNFQTVAEHQSMFNTPSTFSWYMMGLMLKWLKAQGGLAKMAKRNQRKAEKLYQVIDESEFYTSAVQEDCRSWMNVPFRLPNAELDKKFLAQAEVQGFVGLKGHRLVGGVRASLYNAMSEDGVDALVEFMKEFDRN